MNILLSLIFKLMCSISLFKINNLKMNKQSFIFITLLKKNFLVVIIIKVIIKLNNLCNKQS